MKKNFLMIAGGGGIKTGIAYLLSIISGFTPKYSKAKELFKGERFIPDYDTGEVYIIPMDVDQNSAELKRLNALVEQMKTLRDKCGNAMIKVTLLPNVKFAAKGKSSFNLNDVVGENNVNAPLYTALYSSDQRTYSRKYGLEGDMQAGSLLGSFINDPVLNSYFMSSTNDEITIMIAGSVHGGCGASLLPTVFQILRDYFGRHQVGKGEKPTFSNKPRIGLALLLPCYNYPSTEDGTAVEASEHIIRAKAALPRIRQLGADFTVVAGAAQRVMFKGPGAQDYADIAKGSDKQLNPTLPEEIALSTAIHCFFNGDNEGKEAYIAAETSEFSHFPYGDFLSVSFKRLNILLRMLKLYYTADNAGSTAFSQLMDVTNPVLLDFIESRSSTDLIDGRNNIFTAFTEIGWNIPDNEKNIQPIYGCRSLEPIKNVIEAGAPADSSAILAVDREMHKRKNAASPEEFIGALWKNICTYINN